MKTTTVLAKGVAIAMVVVVSLIGFASCDEAGAGNGGSGGNDTNGSGGGGVEFALGDTDAAPAELYVTKGVTDEASGARIYNLTLTGGEVSVGQYGITGTGDAITIQLLSPSEDLASDTYSFGTSAGDMSGLTVYVDYDFGANSGGVHAVIGGEAEVSVSDSTYDISFDLETPSGSIAGSFSGQATAEYELQS